MAPRREPEKSRRRNSTRSRRANATRGKPRGKKTRKRAKKRAKQKRKSKQSKKRSSAAKRGWEKRRKRALLIEAMHDSNWRELAMPTRDELYDYMLWMSEQFDIEISDMYRLYFGYGVSGEAVE